MISKILLQAHHLGLYYDRSWLYKDLSFSLSSGGLLWVLGKNGAGKSTLLKTLIGIIKATKGHCQWETDQRSYLSHELGIHMNFSVEENLKFWKATYQSDCALSSWLDPLTEQTTKSLSKGQKQYLALACHTPANALVWLLDEPLSHLDSYSRKLFLSHLKTHLELGGAAIISSHQRFINYSYSHELVLGI